MDPCLTQTIPVALPTWKKYAQAPTIEGFSEITSLTPAIKEFLKENFINTEGQLASDYLFGKVEMSEESSSPNGGDCIVLTVNKKKKFKSYCKVTHLLDPIRMMQGYYSHPEKGKKREIEKIENPMNQAYVDCLANYLLGQLRERNISPHFCLFFGGFRGVADTYRFNISDEFESYRKYKAFWEKRRKGLFRLLILNPNSEDDEHSEVESESGEIIEFLQKTPSTGLRSGAFSYSTSKTSRSSSSEFKNIEIDISCNFVEECEMKSIDSFESEKEGEKEEEEENEEEEEEEEGDGFEVFAEFEKYPVQLIFQEQMEGVVDDLIEDEEQVGAEYGSALWEEKWTAWMFQIISALCCAQGVLGFTHNDLHSNNILWTSTDQPWLFYKNRAGQVWRVPTYGKIFRIIDFGRAIFRVGEKWFISDDYAKGGDAEGQYYFDSLSSKTKTIYPNPSFDLARFSVGVLETLYPEQPIEKLDGEILSKEDTWEVHETESPLWNLLWSWLIDDNGRNILRDSDGTERYPDFDLYQHISEHIHNAKPQEQITKPLFNKFKIDSNLVGDWETLYPLFC